MAEARPILASALTPMQCRAKAVEAHRRARNAVKKQYQAQGLKLQLISKRDIDIAAKAYLLELRELITEAAKNVDRWIAEGLFGKRAAAQAIRNHSEQRAEIDSEIREGSSGLPSIQ